jgi:hypothetical protein
MDETLASGCEVAEGDRELEIERGEVCASKQCVCPRGALDHFMSRFAAAVVYSMLLKSCRALRLIPCPAAWPPVTISQRPFSGASLAARLKHRRLDPVQTKTVRKVAAQVILTGQGTPEGTPMKPSDQRLLLAPVHYRCVL